MNSIVKLIFSGFLLFFCISCSGSKKIIEKTITYNYQNVEFLPFEVGNSTQDQVSILIQPIDAKSINLETIEFMMRDGSYEKEIATFKERIKSEAEEQKWTDKPHWLGKLRCIEVLESLVQKGEISYETSLFLSRRLILGESYGKDGTEISSLSKVESYSDEYNPYKIDNKYLSVFKATFFNNNKEVKRIKLKDFQIISGEEQLYPLDLGYFEKNLKEYPDKIKNIYRMNLPDELVIAPGQKIVKYLAIPPINTNNEKLNVQLIQGNEVTKFDFTLTLKSASKTYTFNEYTILNELVGGEPNYYFANALIFENGVKYATKNHIALIDKERAQTLVSIYTVGYNLSTKTVKFGKQERVSLNNFKNFKIIQKCQSIKSNK